MPDRRHQRTVLEIPSDHGVRSTTTHVGYESLVEPAARPESLPSPTSASRPGPWTEDVYVSPSGRIFLPADFDFENERPRTLTRHSVRREPPPPQPPRAHVIIGQVLPRPRTITRESWVVPKHLLSA